MDSNAKNATGINSSSSRRRRGGLFRSMGEVVLDVGRDMNPGGETMGSFKIRPTRDCPNAGGTL